MLPAVLLPEEPPVTVGEVPEEVPAGEEPDGDETPVPVAVAEAEPVAGALPEALPVALPLALPLAEPELPEPAWSWKAATPLARA